MRCPKCQQKIHPSAVICNCGYDLKKVSGPFSTLQQSWKKDINYKCTFILGMLWVAIDFIGNIYRDSEPRLNILPLVVICVLLAVSIIRYIYNLLYFSVLREGWGSFSEFFPGLEKLILKLLESESILLISFITIMIFISIIIYKKFYYFTKKSIMYRYF